MAAACSMVRTASATFSTSAGGRCARGWARARRKLISPSRLDAPCTRIVARGPPASIVSGLANRQRARVDDGGWPLALDERDEVFGAQAGQEGEGLLRGATEMRDQDDVVELVQARVHIRRVGHRRLVPVDVEPGTGGRLL